MKISDNMKHLQSRGEIFLGRSGIYILYCQPKNTYRKKGCFEVQKNVRSTRDFPNLGHTMTEKHTDFKFLYAWQKKEDAIRHIVKEEQKDFEAEQRLIDYNKKSGGRKL